MGRGHGDSFGTRFAAVVLVIKAEKRLRCQHSVTLARRPHLMLEAGSQRLEKASELAVRRAPRACGTRVQAQWAS